jgi:hypothetical protein
MDFLLQLDAKTNILGISAIVALFAVYRNSVINRRRATVDLVLHQKNDTDLADANKIINPLLKSNNITKYSDDEYKDSDERAAILEILNNYEFIAVGIREKAFDLALYKRMKYSIVVRDWDCFKSFVYDLRQKKGSKTPFQEFEWLAKKFKKNKLKVDDDY